MAQRSELPPAVMKIVLGRELSRQRNAAGVTQDQAASVLRCTQQKIAHIEAGSGVKAIELDVLLQRYGADEADRTYARNLQAESNRRTKRGAFSTRFPQFMRLLVDMEPSCDRYCTYQAMVIPGLLQTEEYMRTIFRAWRPSPTGEQIDRDTENRLARQRVLDNTENDFWFIVDEAALRRTAGTTSTMKDQIRRLVEIVDRPNIELQIVPFNVGFYMGQGHDYTIFSYDTAPGVDIVYLELPDRGEYVDDGRRTGRYRTLWEQQKAAAIGPEQTRRALLQIADSL